MRSFEAALVIVLLAILAGFSPLTHGVFARGQHSAAHQDYPPRPGATPIVIGLPNLNPTPAPLPTSRPGNGKPANPPDAVRVAIANRYVRALLKGRAFRVKTVVVWSAGPGNIVTLAMYHNATITGTWWAPGKPAYIATYRRVSGLRVYVNSRRSTVVAIVPTMLPQ